MQKQGSLKMYFLLMWTSLVILVTFSIELTIVFINFLEGKKTIFYYKFSIQAKPKIHIWLAGHSFKFSIDLEMYVLLDGLLIKRWWIQQRIFQLFEACRITPVRVCIKWTVDVFRRTKQIILISSRVGYEINLGLSLAPCL